MNMYPSVLYYDTLACIINNSWINYFQTEHLLEYISKQLKEKANLF